MAEHKYELWDGRKDGAAEELQVEAKIKKQGEIKLEMSNTKRIVILGKTGAGKSSLANTIFGEKLFEIGNTGSSETDKCQEKTKSVNGRRITLIDTPGFFDTKRPEEELKAEIVSCITKCSPGPHAFLIVLKVEKFTEQEQAVIKKIKQYFSEEVFKYTTVVFTHGEQLDEGQTIEQYFCSNEAVSDLMKKCGGRCHVVDNKYWNNNRQHEYRSNKFQVEQLLKTIDKITEANRGGCYTNEVLQEWERVIQQEERRIRQSSPNMPVVDIREQAKVSTAKKILIRLAGITTGALLGALLGVVVSFVIVLSVLKSIVIPLQQIMASAAGGGAAAGGAAAGGGALTTLKVTAAGSAAVGAVIGGYKGYQAAEDAETVLEGAGKAAEAVWDGALSVVDKANDLVEKLSRRKN